MELRQITESEAIQIISSEPEYFPFRSINENGKKVVSEWVFKNAKREQNIAAWLDDAEDTANNSIAGEAIIIEMKSYNTISGHTETLIIPADCFDWMINE